MLGAQNKKTAFGRFFCGEKNWWSWRESNPRPQAFAGQIYMFSALFWVLPPGPRRRTLPRMPAPLRLAARQGARRAASRWNFPCSPELLLAPGPGHRHPVARLAGFKRRVRNVRRLQLVC